MITVEIGQPRSGALVHGLVMYDALRPAGLLSGMQQVIAGVGALLLWVIPPPLPLVILIPTLPATAVSPHSFSFLPIPPFPLLFLLPVDCLGVVSAT